MVQKHLFLCTVWLAAWIAQPAFAAFADLSATLSAPPLLARGEPINLTLRVRNNGPEEATAVSVQLELDARLAIASFTIFSDLSKPAAADAFGTCLSTTSTLSCQLPQLAGGDSYTFNILTSATVAAGSFAHIAVVQGSSTDLGLGNNSASAVTTVSEVSQGIGGSSSGGGGGGGNISLTMLAALLLLAMTRAAANKFARPSRRPLS